VIDRFQHAFAEIACGIAVAKLDGFLRPRGCARRHAGATRDSGFENNIGLDGRIAARIENLAGDDIDDGAHVDIPRECCRAVRAPVTGTPPSFRFRENPRA
jgi:hypothetical protein